MSRTKSFERPFVSAWRKWTVVPSWPKFPGIQDEAVLDRLIELNIEAETIAAIAVVPLVAVAWADGKVQEEERQAVLAAAQAAGVQPLDGRYPMLEYWLNTRPGRHLDRSLGTLHRRCLQASQQRGDRIAQTRCAEPVHTVAQAAGGFLGIGSRISTSEQTVLKKLEKAFTQA